MVSVQAILTCTIWQPESNGDTPTVKLSNGYDMPILGLGTYSLEGAICVNSVKAALVVGFRKFDTASIYSNEEDVQDSQLPQRDFLKVFN